jgi:hypothetical protein
MACVGALAFAVAAVAHEAIGHGGMCVATGGHVKLITTVYFRGTDSGPLTDAAGPMANLVLGGLLYLWVKPNRIASPHLHFFAAAAMALNLFWGSGYFIYSGISNTGDWAFVVRGLALQPPWLWRAILVVLGVYCYGFSIVATGRALARFADISGEGPAKRPLFRVSLILYLSAGIACCLAVLPFRGALGPAFHESVRESFEAFVGLLYVAARRTVPGQATDAGRAALPRSWKWIAGSLAWLILFAAVMGRGYSA